MPAVRPVSFALICFIVPSLATLLVAWGVQGLQRYDYSLFLGVPLVIGVLTALLYGRGRVWKWRDLLGLTVINLVLSAGGVLLCRIEGVICIAMAAFLVAAVTFLGILISWAVQHCRRRGHYHAIALLSLPLLMKWEAGLTPQLPVMEETSAIEVNAPPEIVWRFIPSFPEISGAPSGWLATGLAYPVRSEIDGPGGVGAARRCVLSTGVIPEVITVWEPGRRLEFDVLSTPPSMVETNPFGEVHAPHTDGYFQSRHGRFVLTPLPGGRTRIEGTSSFTQNLRPSWYWGPITRYTVRQVHRRVLEHIRVLAEQATAAEKAEIRTGPISPPP